MKSIKLLAKILACLVIGLCLRMIMNHYVMFIEINGKSMEPTLPEGSLGIAMKINLEDIERGDIVIIDKGNADYIIKRIIGLPGETISCTQNKIYINSKEIEDEFLENTWDFEEIKLGEDEIFVLGDNRLKSFDSRHDGPFKVSQIVANNVKYFSNQTSK